jgi:lipopolysaccharide export system permease protein
LIDRHVLSQCLQALGLALAAIVGLLLLQNIYDNLKDLVESGASEGDIALYYLVLIPSFLPTVMPLAFLISILFGPRPVAPQQRDRRHARLRCSGSGASRGASGGWAPRLDAVLLFYLNAQLVPWSVEKAQHIWEGYAFASSSRKAKRRPSVSCGGLPTTTTPRTASGFLNRFSQYNYRRLRHHGLQTG